MIYTLLLIGVVYYITQWLTKPDPERLLGVYGQAGKWYFLKFHLMKFVIGRRQKKSKIDNKKEDLMNSQFGGSGKRSEKELDCKHELPKDKARPIDAVFFDASNAEGYYFTLGTAQRKDNIINLFFILRTPDHGTFIAPEMLTSSNVKSVETDKAWETESGFKVECIEPMKKWKLSFKGNLTPSTGEKILTTVGPDEAPENVELIPASFEVYWTNYGDYFDFDVECSPTSIAHSLAIEPWSRALFDRLKASHQTHYEQFGLLEGNFTIGEHSFKPNVMKSMRDHTIAGHRSWAELRRYIMMIYHLEDGTCIHTSVISMPETVFSHLEFGYVITPEKKKVPVDRVYFELPYHGEDKDFPKKFHYSFDAGHLHYDVDVHIIESVSFKMGLDLAAQVNENMATFVANGIKGYGFSETEYRIEPY